MDKSTRKQMNEDFCYDAAELRFERMDGTFFKAHHLHANEVDPFVISVLRSVKSEGKNCFVFVMDIDGEEQTRAMLEAAKDAAMGMKNYFGVPCFVKDTASRGYHTVGFVEYPYLWKEHKCLEHMRGMAVTVHYLMSLRHRHGVGIGKGVDKPYVDLCMFDNGRMVRAFSAHPKTHKVPTVVDGHAPTQVHRAVRYHRPDLQRPLCEQDHNEYFGDYTVVPDEYLRRVKLPTTAYLPKMPKKLQKLVAFDGDPPHEHKWGLVLWMRRNTSMTHDQIAKWIWENCKWEDLDDWDKTRKQVFYTCRWSDRIFESSGKRPVPRWIYD